LWLVQQHKFNILTLLLLHVGLLLLNQLMLLANVGQSGQLAPQANRRLPMIANVQCAVAADVELAAATAVAAAAAAVVAAAAVELAVVVVVGITVFIVLIWKQP
jgi:hypothetical protein